MSAPARLIAVSDSSAAVPLVEPALRGGRLDHRVLAGDVVGGERQVEALARGADHVEVRQRRLDHDHVGALGDVELALAQRLADVGGIHLVAAPVAERRRRVGRLAERPVERGGVLGRVGDDRRLRAAPRGSRRRGRPSCRSGRRRRRRPRRGETAVRASRSSVASLSTSPPSSTPQWPCAVYSQRQTSVSSTSSGKRGRSSRSARWTTPSSSQAPEPSSSFSSGIPNRITPRTPAATSRVDLLGELLDRPAPHRRQRLVRLASPARRRAA